MNNNQNYVFNSKLDIQIRMTDLDTFNHVNNGVLSAYFDLGRLNYLKELTGCVDLLSLDLVLVHTEYDFFDSVRFQNQIVVETKIIALGDKSVKMMQRIMDKHDKNKCYCTCFSILSGYNHQNNSSKTIDEQFKQKVIDFEKDI